jgi:citrate lyase subunit beta/citryl-CoA lyase
MPNPETSPDARPLRSLLYMPASNRRAIDKARGLDTDAVALDLEDAVAPEMKAEARAALLEELAPGGFGHRRLIARINALDTPWGTTISPRWPCAGGSGAGPKVDDADDVIALSRAMDAPAMRPA